MGEFTQEFANQKITHNAVEKRIKEIKTLLDYFLSYHGPENNLNISAADYSAEKITKLYYELLYKEVKGYVPKKINRYKIGALTELCIVALQPLSSNDNSYSNRKLNAAFALFASSSIILEANTKIEGLTKLSGNKRVNDVFEISKNQRLVWLESKNEFSFPIFINGLALFTLFELYHQRFQALPL